MKFSRMALENWFDNNQYAIDYNLGESAIQYRTFGELGLDLDDVALRYGYHQGEPGLRELLAPDYEGLSADNLVITSGASEGIFGLVGGLLQPSDHVIIEHPNYASLYENPRAMGCDVSLLTLKFEDDYLPDLERLQSMIRPETKLIALTHPSNPTGSQLSLEMLEAVIEIAERHDIWLLFDELYRDFAFDNPLPTAASLSRKAISLASMSKIYGLPGIRIGWVACQDRQVINAIRDVREHLTISNSTLSEAVATQVLQNKSQHMLWARDLVERNRAIVDRWINKHPYFEWVAPAVGINSFPRIKSDAPFSPDVFFASLVNDFKTFVVPGTPFEYAANYFRMGFGSHSAELETGLQNMDRCIENLLADSPLPVHASS